MAMSDAERQRKRWAKRTPEQIAARSQYRKAYWKSYDAARKEEAAAKKRAQWAAMTPGQRAIESVRKRASRYNLSETVVHEMLSSGCVYPDSDHQGLLHIDHDHSCCSETWNSCGKCVRGVLCAKHNLMVGHFEKIAPHLVWLVSYLAFAAREEDK